MRGVGCGGALPQDLSHGIEPRFGHSGCNTEWSGMESLAGRGTALPRLATPNLRQRVVS